MIREEALGYLRLVSEFGLCPNFWMSEEYVQKAGLVWIKRGLLEGFVAGNDSDEWFFPPIKNGSFVFNDNIYCGFVDYSIPFVQSDFLDYQFIYNPSDFLDLSGGKWKVFRKNIRKYIRRIQYDVVYRPLQLDEQSEQVESLLLRWSSGGEFYDPDVMIRFILQGNNREGLFVGGMLVGLNVFDENFMFINYRYCLDDGSPFLNELMRFYFYTNSARRRKLVNDGGSLGLEGLYRFKCKLNPLTVFKVFTYKKTWC